jgi:hypothetical protein
MLKSSMLKLGQDFEICVPEDSVEDAARQLCSTGLFKRMDVLSYDNYSEYKKGYPQLRITGWMLPMDLVIFSDRYLGLAPLTVTVIDRKEFEGTSFYSKEVTDGNASADIPKLPWPRLPQVLKGQAHLWITRKYDMAMIAVEELVDGMAIDTAWCEKHLCDASPEVQSLIRGLVESKHSRLDPFLPNKINCFVLDEEEERKLHDLPGYS